jgi:hypothetical protein
MVASAVRVKGQLWGAGAGAVFPGVKTRNQRHNQSLNTHYKEKQKEKAFLADSVI